VGVPKLKLFLFQIFGRSNLSQIKFSFENVMATSFNPQKDLFNGV
jgi:hypothetical protein